jgi:hypothetical protein
MLQETCDLIVIAYENESQDSGDVLVHQSQSEAHTALIDFAAQFPQSDAAVGMRLTEGIARGVDRLAQLNPLGF